MESGIPKLIGWVDCAGDEGDNLRILKDGKVERHLAQHVLQVTFVGYSGFRFPICHFPTDTAKASELIIVLHEVIAKLSDWNFTVDYILQDGGAENRQCINAHFKGNPAQDRFRSRHILNSEKWLMHSQDFSHNIKKLRNAVLSSGCKGHHTRYLIKNELPIVWQQWIDAVQWDRNTSARPVHRKITDEPPNPHNFHDIHV